jgi:hypothetical protein
MLLIWQHILPILADATGQSRISVQDYAVAMIDELERPTHLRQRFTRSLSRARLVRPWPKLW